MARVLIKQKVAKAIAQASGEKQDPEDLAPGHMRLYGYFVPGLDAGLYKIETRQLVQAPGSTDLNIWNYKGKKLDAPPPTVEQQLVSVQAPQFSIDTSLINLYYPPPGHQDAPRILPHIVFSDPHMPWLREAGTSTAALSHDDISSNTRHIVPWMALAVFEADELVVPEAEAPPLGLSAIPDCYNAAKLPANGAFQMTVGDYLTKITSGHNISYHNAYVKAGATQDWDDLTKSKDMTSVIFPNKSRILEIFGQPGQLEAQKYLAHVRRINTIGFPDAGVEEEGDFSVVVSSTTGSVKTKKPITQVVHLISIEHLDTTINDPDFLESEKVIPSTQSSSGTEGSIPPPISHRVGVVSLFSWIYTAIPEAVDFVRTMEDIAAHMQPLKPPVSLLVSLQQQGGASPPTKLSSAALQLHDRLDKGYTICRWRAATGEQTAAINRGPLVPLPTPDVPQSNSSSWPAQSMSGKEFQIFDKDVGIMDLTYSSAWSLGRLVAISDSAFNAALLRFRSSVWGQSSSDTRMASNNIATTKNVLARAPATMMDVSLTRPKHFKGPVGRLTAPLVQAEPVLPLSHANVAPLFAQAIAKSVAVHASTAEDGTTDVFNDFNPEKAANSDWELIHNWISDSLYLAHIPAHVLFPEPSFILGDAQPPPPGGLPSLPPHEALRFFYIDNAWLDCFLDGALSCANHLDPQFDSPRQRMKEVYNQYLASNIKSLDKKSPPVPRSGFVFRSSVVKAIPDLKITVITLDKKPRDPVVRTTRMDDSTILCLLDCLLTEMAQVTFAQPAHQQRFAMGSSLKPAADGSIIPELEVRMLYTEQTLSDGKSQDPRMGDPAPSQPPKTDQLLYFNKDTRCIDAAKIATSVNASLISSDALLKSSHYRDSDPDSCLVGLQLNDPSYQITIKGPPAPSTPDHQVPTSIWKRQLWTGITSPNTTHAPGAARATAPITTIAATTTTAPMAVASARSSQQPQQPPALSKTDRMPVAPAGAPLNSTRVVPAVASVNPSAKLPSQISIIPGPQFRLICHPHYRPPPPTPYQTTSGGNVYAPMDYLPTDTVYLFDMIIAIRRINPNTAPGYRLSELSIEFPVSNGQGDLVNGVVREPLFPAGGYRGPGARMTSDFRFVPTLYQYVDDKKQSWLGVKLVPRSGLADATILLTNDGRTTEASVRLAECEIAPITDPKTGVRVAGVDKQGKGTETSTWEPRGICKISLKEVYLREDGSKQTLTTDGHTNPVPLWVLKRAGGDFDLNGEIV